MTDVAIDSAIRKAFEFQAALCRHFQSPLYAELLERAADDEAVRAIVGDWPGNPMKDYVALRLLGGVHQLVLTGAAPALAAHYPTAGGKPSWPDLWKAFRQTLDEHRDFLRAFLSTTPQTNEIARSAALATGFHSVSLESGKPLRLREIGASAGLNLLFDRYAFEFGDAHWGDQDGRPVLRPEWTGAPPPLSAALAVESRAGCDLAPIRLADEAARMRLQAYVWPDQPERLERMRRAIDIALDDPPRLDQARAGDWIERELESLPADTATVVYHSSFWVYVPSEEQRRITQCIERAGARASRDRSLHWLRLEDVEARFELRLRSWPGGHDQLLALSDPHGRGVQWLGDAPEPA